MKTPPESSANTQLFTYLSILSKDEFKRLKDFILSPVFNSNASLLALYETIKPFFVKGNLAAWNKEAAYSKIYPSRSYNSGSMRSLMSELTDVIGAMLAFRNRKNGDGNLMPDELRFLLEICDISALESDFQKKAAAYQLVLDAETVQDYDFYFRKTILLTLQQRQHAKALEDVEETYNIHQKRLESIVLYFLILALDAYRCVGQMNYTRQADYSFNFLFKKEVEQHLEENKEYYKNTSATVLLSNSRY